MTYRSRTELEFQTDISAHTCVGCINDVCLNLREF